jgi:hypothetical protein
MLTLEEVEVISAQMVGLVIFTVGTVLSEDAGAEEVTVRVSVPLLPAASCAVTVITFVPLCRPTDAMLQVVVPLENPLPPRSFDHDTAVTPRLSDEVPPIVMTDDVVA